MKDSSAIALAVIGLLVIIAPPMWWYSRGRKLGEKRKRNWTAIHLGAFLIASEGITPMPTKGDWLLKSFNLARALAGVWLIAFGAKGSPVR
jgi:hypothetical protein